MKSSVSPRAILLFALGALLLPSGVTLSQDILTLTNGQRREGKILGVRDGNVRYQAGPVEASLPLSQVASARMSPPPEFEQTLEAWKVGDAAKTLSLLNPLVENYRGLPASWVERASAMLGAVYLEKGDVPGAEAAFAEFQKAYPQAQNLADLGLARLAVEKDDLATARGKVVPIVEAARSTLIAESGKSAEYGQACLIMGQILESEGQYAEALDHYLLTVTVFHEDPAATQKARDRAAALAAEKNAMVP